MQSTTTNNTSDVRFLAGKLWTREFDERSDRSSTAAKSESEQIYVEAVARDRLAQAKRSLPPKSWPRFGCGQSNRQYLHDRPAQLTAAA
jgi:hypothetical protein